MTVQELIDELMQVENKSVPFAVSHYDRFKDDWGRYELLNIDEEERCVSAGQIGKRIPYGSEEIDEYDEDE